MKSKTITPKQLLEFMEKVPDKEEYLFLTEEGWYITNEWLCGTFAGRAFIGKTKKEAAQKLISYLNQHTNHNSIVGQCVRESGWPDLYKVRNYIKNKEI